MLSLYCKMKALRATRDEGVTAAEYALILFLVITVIGGIVAIFGQQIRQVFQDSCDAIGNGGC